MPVTIGITFTLPNPWALRVTDRVTEVIFKLQRLIVFRGFGGAAYLKQTSKRKAFAIVKNAITIV